MASGRRFYSVERRGHRDGYAMEDVDNELLRDHARRRLEGDKWIWNGLPEELLSAADVDDIWRRWRIAMPVSLFGCLDEPILILCRLQTSEFLRMRADTSAISFTSQVWHT
jgi:hypothetical protein